jgi:uncharacterized protein YciI
MDFDRYTFVLLRRGPRAMEMRRDEIDRHQAAHLAHLDAMRQRGVLVAAGPFEDQDDETKRGICIYRTDLEETRRLAAQDPSVQAGRLAIEAMTWLTLKGKLKA